MTINYELPWHDKAFSEVSNQNNFPQSLLIYGPEGIGKFSFALRLANYLLCESSNKLKPCTECSGCKWFAAGNHPDFIGILPEEILHLLPQDLQFSEGKDSSEDKKLSKFIKIDQIREALADLNLATYRGGKKILLINPVESMQTAASNSLLKALEEPPQNIIFILVSNQIDRVLPTIRSRCRLLALQKPSIQESLDWFSNNNMEKNYSRDYYEQALRESGGAPLIALTQLQSSLLENTKKILFEYLPNGKSIDWLTAAEKLSKFPIIDSILVIQRWVFDLISVSNSGAIKYYPANAAQLNYLASNTTDLKIIKFNDICLEAKKRASHSLAVKLQIENLLLQYSKIFN